MKSKLPEQEWKDLVASLPQTEFGKREKWTNGKVTFELFPEGYIALQRELMTGLHPKLYPTLENIPASELDMRLAAVSLYCGVILDGTYTLAERDKLCYILCGRLEVLREKPSGIILSS